MVYVYLDTYDEIIFPQSYNINIYYILRKCTVKSVLLTKIKNINIYEYQIR